MAERFECDKCHQLFPSPTGKKAVLNLKELGAWTDHPDRPMYNHTSELCLLCFERLRNAISQPHRPLTKAPHASLSVGQPTEKVKAVAKAEHCQDCGAVIKTDLSCTEGCAGMQGVREAQQTIERIYLQHAMALLDRVQNHTDRALGGIIADWLDAMKANGYQPTEI